MFYIASVEYKCMCLTAFVYAALSFWLIPQCFSCRFFVNRLWILVDFNWGFGLFTISNRRLNFPFVKNILKRIRKKTLFFMHHEYFQQIWFFGESMQCQKLCRKVYKWNSPAHISSPAMFKLNMCFGKFIELEWVDKVAWSIHGYRLNQHGTLWTNAFTWTSPVGRKIQGLSCRQLWSPEQHILIKIDADAK